MRTITVTTTYRGHVYEVREYHCGSEADGGLHISRDGRHLYGTGISGLRPNPLPRQLQRRVSRLLAAADYDE